MLLRKDVSRIGVAVTPTMVAHWSHIEDCDGRYYIVLNVLFPGIGDWVVWSELEAMVSHPKVLNVMQIPNYNVLFQYMDNLISAMCNGEFTTPPSNRR